MNQVNQSAGSRAEQVSFDQLVEHLKPTGAVLRACGLCGATGTLTLMAGLQLIGSIRFRLSILDYVPYLLALLGVGLIAVTFRAYRMREGAGKTGLVLSLVSLPINLGWQAFMVSQGVLSLVGMLTPAASLAASLLFWAALPSFRAADAARQKMQDAGMDLGF